jgi:outer membrane receptor protein involved in Fe transport
MPNCSFLNRFFQILILCLACCLAHAQENLNKKICTISGRISDGSNKMPIEYASIALYEQGNKKPVNGTTSDKKGLFLLTVADSGNYQLIINFIGYKPDTLTVTLVGKAATKHLEDIMLSKRSQLLQDVVVTAQKPLLENKIDKMVYNAERDVTAQGGVATDLLKKIPQVSVDADGNVELQGNSNISFLINGKPSSIFGNSLSDALQAIPASQIKSIEVITSPRAKYDAEGTGGIINIILKDSKVRGINGNVNVSVGSRLENGSLNLHVRRGNFGLNGFLSGNGQLNSTTVTHLNRSSFDTIAQTHNSLLQDGSNTFHRTGYQSGLGFEWEIDKKNNLSGNFGYDYFANQSNGNTRQQAITETLPLPGNPVAAIISSFTPSNKFHVATKDYSLNYKKTFAKEDRQLDASINTSFGNSIQNYTQQQRNSTGDSVLTALQSSNPGFDHEMEMQVNYTEPFAKNVKMETGLKAAFRDIESASDVYAFSSSSNVYNFDSSQSNSLHYKRQVYAAYVSLNFPVGKWLELKPGLRFERTETNANFSKVGQTAIPGYNTFAPSILFAHHISETQTLKLSYTRRIQRPGFRFLNPFVNALDPKNISQGNPNLQPEIGDNAEFGYSRSFEKGGSINANLFYRGSRQDIQPYIVYYPNFKVGDSVYNNVSVNTFENIGTEHMFGLSLYGSVPVTEKFNLRSNFSLFDKYILNRFVSNTSTNSLNYRINLNASYQASKTLVMEFFGNFNSPRNEVQGKYPSFTTYNFALRKLVWNKKGSFGFTTTNPFNKYVPQQTEITGQQFVLTSLRQIPFRSFGISFSYKFGKLEFKKEKEDNNGGANGGENN